MPYTGPQTPEELSAFRERQRQIERRHKDKLAAKDKDRLVRELEVRAKLTEQEHRQAAVDAAETLKDALAHLASGRPVDPSWVRQRMGEVAQLALRAHDFKGLGAIIEQIGRSVERVPDSGDDVDDPEVALELVRSAAEALGYKLTR